MNDTIPAPLPASPPSTSPKGNVVLRLTRHLIGVSAAVALMPSVIYGPGRGFAWLGGVLFCVLGAAVVAALAALFFTRTQEPKSTHNFILTAWAIVGLTNPLWPMGW